MSTGVGGRGKGGDGVQFVNRKASYEVKVLLQAIMNWTLVVSVLKLVKGTDSLIFMSYKQGPTFSVILSLLLYLDVCMGGACGRGCQRPDSSRARASVINT